MYDKNGISEFNFKQIYDQKERADKAVVTNSQGLTGENGPMEELLCNAQSCV